MRYLTAFWDFVDRRAIVRRIAFFVTLVMSWESFVWARDFATTTAKTGAEVGLIIAAVTAPVAALQGFVLKVYSDARS
jgi:hypothetical protein